MATNHFVFKLTFLSFVLLPIVVSADAFPVHRTKNLSKIRAVNAAGPYYGLITSSRSVEEEFFNTTDFVPDPDTPYIDLAGRRFRIGVAEEKRVIFVRTGGGLVNAAATTQLLLDVFPIYGVVNFGAAGITNDSLKIGDVVVPNEFASTGVWEWVNRNNLLPPGQVRLEVANYNVPRDGSNLLGRIGFLPEEFYSETGEAGNGVNKIWFQVDDYYHRIASNLTDGGNDLPNIVTGVRGSTSGIYVNNAAYREFLYQHFHVSSVDTESSAIVMTCLSLGKRVIVFRGLSNYAGRELLIQSEDASKNVAIAVARFINALPIIVQDKRAEAKLIKQVLED